MSDIELAQPLASAPPPGERVLARSRWFSTHLWKPGLRLKVVGLVFTISLVSIISYTLILYRYQYNQLIDIARSNAATLNATIETSLHHAFVTNDWMMAEELVQAYAQGQTISRLRILNDKAVSVASSEPGEQGTQYAITDPVCSECHINGGTPNQKTAIYQVDDQQQVFLDVTLLHNDPDCQVCHPAEEEILGLVILETPLEEMQSQLKENSLRTGIFAGGALLLLLGIMLPVLDRSLLVPVEGLSRDILRISAGNLDSPVQARTKDELGVLSEALESMRQQLQTIYKEMEKREQEALTLYELGMKISASLALNDVLDAVANAARQLFNADVGLVGLLDKERNEIVIEAVSGDSQREFKGQRLSVEGIPHLRTPSGGSQSSVEVYDPTDPAPVLHNLLPESHTASFLAVPLQRGEHFLGVLEVLSHQPRRFVGADAQLLARLANQVEVSIENAQLHRQFRFIATLEERNRLAREMHDQLAQALGYLNVKAAITEDQLTRGQLDQVKESLAEMKRAARVVYTDVREAIFNLRTSISSEREFLPTLRQYLHEYQLSYGLRTMLAVGHEELGDISQDAASQALFIIQEALANVRKHSKADSVWIHLVQEEEFMRISVEDNGCGFDPEATGNNGQSYGLQIMYERAESVNGSLEIYTHPDRGTRIDVRIPVIP